MSRRRRRSSQSTGVAIVVLLFLVLWYMGKIPGLPPVGAILPGIKELGTLVVITTPVPAASPLPTVPASAQPLGQRTKTSGCVAGNGLPDAQCTPGAIFPDATKEQVCTPGYSTSVRNVPQSVKDEVYAEYGIASHEPGQYEVDHLVSLELGGSNDIANLWPEPAEPTPGFHQKDQVEDYLHQQVCDGAISLQEAQAIIAHDWVKVYETMPK